MEEYIGKGNKLNFDIVTSMEVIEHVDEPKVFIGQLKKAMSSSGVLMLSTISRTPSSYLSHILAAEYIMGMVPKGTHSYNKFINPEECKAILEANGLRV